MKNIIISPYSKPLRNGKQNPKDYPHWDAVIREMNLLGHHVVQLKYGDEVEMMGCEVAPYTKLSDVEKLIDQCDLFIGVDNFLQHLAHQRKRRGIVIWGKSNPELFGYPENVNLLKSPKYLRGKQFDIWESEEFDSNVFVHPQIVVEAVKNFDV